jgi:hypothetical protein
MTDLKSIVEEHIDIRKKLKLTKLDDNTLFSEAVRRLNTIKMDSRPAPSKGPTPEQGPRKKTFKELNAPATDKQVNFLKELGLEEIPAGLTKIDADMLIKEKVREKEQKEREQSGDAGY